jgi:CHASE1-domain containing sensor protein
MAQKNKKHARKTPAARSTPAMATAVKTAEVAAPLSGAGKTYVTEFNPDYSQTIKDLKRIGILAGSFFALLIVLAFIMP